MADDPIERLFALSSVPYGVHGVMFYKMGGWEWVVIDDFVPVDPDTGTTLFAGCNGPAVASGGRHPGGSASCLSPSSERNPG